jgi:hypothetical protein
MSRFHFALPFVFVCLLLAAIADQLAAQSKPAAVPAIPLFFEENKGQAPPNYQAPRISLRHSIPGGTRGQERVKKWLRADDAELCRLRA